jgi:exo-beta-1,3-glucanase (GH17 family)
LVVYVVGAAGVMGWWLFLTIQNQQVEKQLADLTAQVQQQQALESAVWQVSSRSELASVFLTERVQISSVAATLLPQEQVAITAWKYGDTGQTLGLQVGQVSELEIYSERLKTSFPKIGISTLLFSSTDPNWTVSLAL